MSNEHVTIDPRYLSYDKDEVEALLGKVAAQETATEENVRAIVTEYQTEQH